MPLVCPRCASWSLDNAERQVDVLRCEACGGVVAVNILPLFVVTGASGAGKSTIAPALRSRLRECVVFDKDLIWGASWDQVYNNWLRIAYSIAQGGRHTVICGTSDVVTTSVVSRL
jgi:hypothetical protein